MNQVMRDNFIFCFKPILLNSIEHFLYSFLNNLVNWGCRIYRLHLCGGVRPSPNESLGYDIKQSDDEAPVMLELWGMQSTLSMPLLPSPL